MRILTNPLGSWAPSRGSMRLPRLGIGLVSVAGLLALAVASMGPIGAQAQTLKAAGSTTEGSYVAVTPYRVADTRPGSGQAYAGQTLGTAATLNVQVTGTAAGDAPAGAAAAVLNVTAVDPTAPGFLTVFPAGTTMPTVSNLNFAAGTIVPNLVTVGLSSTGMVSIYNLTGNTDVVVDVEGYYSSTPASNGSGLYNALSPYRVAGTLQIGQLFGTNSTAAVPVTGVDGVPTTATAVVVNVTAAWATLPSFLTVYPAGATQPLASDLNFGAQATNQAIANRVTVGVGTSGNIDIYNLQGNVNVDVDVDGYYTGAGGTGSAFVAIQPQRLTDTRSSTNGTSIPASTSEAFALNNTTSGGTIPTNAAAVAANFTVVPGADPGYLTVYPTADTTVPVASDVNWTASESPAVPNYTIADTAGTGSVSAFNSHGATIDVVIDAFGYFTAFATTPTMVSATVTDTAITITYNEGVACPATGADGAFTYDYSGSASGGTVTGCTAVGDVLTLTGTFTLPIGTNGTILYTAPTGGTTANAVYASSNTAEFAATQTIAVTAGAAPAMVSATAGTNLLRITYNEDVTCPGTAYNDFVYDYTTGVSGDTAITACSATANVLDLTLTSGIAPTSTASIVYTVPTAGNTSTTAVYATGSVPPVYAATQTLSGSQWTTPTITGATVTPGVSGTGTIAVTYSGDGVMTCPTAGANTVQTEFAYSNSGSTAYPSTCANTSTHVITLGTFYNATTGTTGATLLLPGASDTLTYTAPSATNTTVNSVYATLDAPQFPATQTFDLTATAAPTMTSAVVNAGTSIVILYNLAVSCPATGADGDFVYDSAIGVPGGTATGCTGSGTTSLTLTGAFNAAAGSASLTYNEPGAPSTSNAVYRTGTTTDFVATQTLSGSTEIS